MSQPLLNRAQELVSLEQCCDEFEAAWRAGERPKFADFLSRLQPNLRERGFSELLAIEAGYRRKNAEQPTPDDYIASFPEFTEKIRREFEAIEPTQILNDTITALGSPAKLPAERLAQRIDDYELLEELARGGMGVVYKARQLSLDRIVAVKLIRETESESSDHIDRFLVEQRAAAALRHPGIVAVFAAGRWEGQHFYSMELVEGETLSQVVQQRPTPLEAARIVRDCAAAVHYAHEHGVLHRDLKPSNIMLDRDGHVRITDFGLAKRLSVSHDLTATGQIIGTPSYMSPEQAGGDPDAVDRRADIYSLGAVLYALLTGRPPHEGKSITATLLSVAHTPPRPPREVDASIDAALEQICLKCLTKLPEARFQTAAELAQALDSYLSRPDQTTVVSRPPASRPRASRWIAAMALLAVMALGTFVVRVSTDRGELVIQSSDPQVAVVIQQSAVKLQDARSGRTYDLRAGTQALKSGNYVIAVSDDNGLRFDTTEFRIERNGEVSVKAWIEPSKQVATAVTPAPTQSGESPSKPVLADAIYAIPVDPLPPFQRGAPLGKYALVRKPAELENVLSWTVESRGLRNPTSQARSAYRPDSRQVATASTDGSVRIWDVADGRLVRMLMAPDEIDSIAWSPDGSYLATALRQGGILLWHMESGRLLRTLPSKAGLASALAWSPDRRFIACAVENQGVTVWDISSAKPHVLLSSQDRVASLAWHPKGTQLGVAGSSKTVELYEVELGRKLRSWADHADGVVSLAWSSDGKLLASAGLDHKVNVYDPTSQEISTISVSQTLARVQFWPDDDHLLTSFLAGGAELRSRTTGAVERQFGGPAGNQWFLATADNGETQLTWSRDRTLCLHVLKNGTENSIPGRNAYFLEPKSDDPLPQMAWSPVAPQIAFGTPIVSNQVNSSPVVWNLGRGELVRASPESLHRQIASLAWSADGETLASGGENPEMQIWNRVLERQHRLATGGSVAALAFSRTGERLAIGNQGGQLSVWNAERGTKELDLPGHKSSLSACQWSPDDQRLASASHDGTVVIWDVAQKLALHTFSRQEDGQPLGELHSLDWSPNGRFVAAGMDRWIVVWNPESGKIVHQFNTGGSTCNLRFSHDSQRLASADGIRQGTIWDLASGTAVIRLDHPSAVWGVSWSADDHWLACSSNDEVQVWDARTGERRMTLIPMGIGSGLALTPRGDLRASKSLQDDLVYIVQTAEGQQLLTSAQFAERFRWKNNETALTVPGSVPLANINSRAFQTWLKQVAALPADKQVAAVQKKLVELNPEFDGQVTSRIDKGMVVQLQLITDEVTDLAPVRALPGLVSLTCSGSAIGKGRLADLSPLKGLKLTSLRCEYTQVSDLSSLAGMPLTMLNCGTTPVSDLSPLAGMPLKTLYCGVTRVTDLSPLRGLPLTFLNCTSSGISDLSPLVGMPLTWLDCYATKIWDLSPLKGMPLNNLSCAATFVSDLSPLEGLNLSEVGFSHRNIRRGMDALRRMKTLKRVGVRGGDAGIFTAEEFWKRYDAGEFQHVARMNDPEFQQWVAQTQKLPADRQLDAVRKKLMEWNPGFDGQLIGFAVGSTAPRIEKGVVTELGIISNSVIDLSPVCGFPGLQALSCKGAKPTNGKLFDLAPLAGLPLTKIDVDGNVTLTDLSPLRGMKLTSLSSNYTAVKDFTLLQGMPLKHLHTGGEAQITDLSFLKGMPLEILYVHGSFSDLSPLRGMPLRSLDCNNSQVTNLSPLKGMPLSNLNCEKTQVTDLSTLDGLKLELVTLSPRYITRGMDVLRRMTTLKSISVGGTIGALSVEEFWRRYDTGEFTKTLASRNDPAFQQWLNQTQALPAEQQLEAVGKMLTELNPGFDGQLKGFTTDTAPRIEKGVVTDIGIFSNSVTDLSPLRAFPGLQMLRSSGQPINGKLYDLTPLAGLPLTKLNVTGNPALSDLSPLRGMKLVYFESNYTAVNDFSALQGMPLAYLHTGGAFLTDLSFVKGMSLEIAYLSGSFSDLSPLRGMPLRHLASRQSQVSDLSPLQGMPLSILNVDGSRVSDLSPLKDCKKLNRASFKATKVGLEQVRSLQQALPDCKVDWDDPAKPAPAEKGVKEEPSDS